MSRSPNFTPEMDALLIAMAAEEIPIKDQAVRLGVTAGQGDSRRRSLKIRMARRAWSAAESIRAAELYRSGHSCAAIGKIMGWNATSIIEHLTADGVYIPLRSRVVVQKPKSSDAKAYVDLGDGVVIRKDMRAPVSLSAGLEWGAQA